ncbi:hypothetical protein O181_009609 [Austropuccinia psidii MF-1]|uniref:Uncharacterized protein n=1 Tax=Austropuccinia psidii MF-1 TaxID=1389203 RepID=A0A9Q3BR36_9BASI|nr:hypothetical protein [Austropuccinia psidii MF-1]
MEESQKEWELLLRLGIVEMNSYLTVHKLLGPERTKELLKSWTPSSFKGEVQKIKVWLKNKRIISEEHKKEWAQNKDNTPVEASQASKSAKYRQEIPKEQSERQEKGKAQVEQTLPLRLQDSKERNNRHGQCVQYGKNLYGTQLQGGGRN